MIRRIKRDFRQVRSPAKHLAFCKKVKYCLTGNPNLPASMAPLLQQYYELVDSFEAAHHSALDGSRTLIRQRDKLGEEIVVLLEQIASSLEAEFVQNPDALLTTGFTITQEGRSSKKAKPALGAPWDFNVVNLSEQGKAQATASNVPGAIVHEIHANQTDPSLEDAWFHKAIFPDAKDMEMNGLAAGNTFFRMRHYNQDGPGPWSVVVATTIT
jgi:hypothetical protein